MSDESAEAELRSIIDLLRSELDTDQSVSTLPKSKVEVLLKLAEYEEELLQFAKYSRARQMFISQWRGFLIGSAAVVTAVVTITPAYILDYVWRFWTGGQ